MTRSFSSAKLQPWTLDPESVTKDGAHGSQQPAGCNSCCFHSCIVCLAAHSLLLCKGAAPRLETAMGDFVPILTAVASGTFDSIENVFINIARHIPLLNNVRRRKELDQCLSGKVSSTGSLFGRRVRSNSIGLLLYAC